MICLALAQVLSGTQSIDYWFWDSLRTERCLVTTGLVGFYEDLEVGLRLAYEQSASNLDWGIIQIYGDWQGEDIRARGGSIYETWDYGLVLSAAPEPEVSLDRWLVGGALTVEVGPLWAEVLTGSRKELYYYSLTGDKGTAHGARVGAAVGPLRLGFNYLRVNSVQLDSTYATELYGPAGNLRLGPLSLSLEMARRQGFYEAKWLVDTPPDTLTWSYYGTVGLNLPRFGALLELKNYDLLATGYNRPPPANQEGLYLSDTLNEAGHSLSLHGSPFPGVHLSGVRSRSLSPDSAKALEENVFGIEYTKPGKVLAKLEAERLMAWGGVVEEILGDTLLVKPDRRVEDRLGGEVVLYGPPPTSLTLKARLQAREDDTLRYQDQRVGLGASWAPLIEVSITYERRVSGGEVWDSWRWVSLTLRPKDNLEVSLLWGKTKGELLCSGGVCRYEPPFKGIKLLTNLRF